MRLSLIHGNYLVKVNKPINPSLLSCYYCHIPSSSHGLCYMDSAICFQLPVCDHWYVFNVPSNLLANALISFYMSSRT